MCLDPGWESRSAFYHGQTSFALSRDRGIQAAPGRARFEAGTFSRRRFGVETNQFA
jgi:hypothetical protein